MKNGSDKRKVFDNAELAETMTDCGSFAPDEDINVTFTNNASAQEFVITVWREESNQVEAESNQVEDLDTPKVSLSNKQRDIVNFCSVPRTTKEILDRIGVSMHSKNRERYIIAFCIGHSNCGSLNIGNWLYVMLVLFGANVVYCIYMVMVEMRKRKKMLELMTGNDMLPYVRYAQASIFSLFFAALVMPFAILSTTLLYIIGPLALLSVLFFNLSFVALGYNYVPTEELLDKEAEEIAAIADEETEIGGVSLESSDGQDAESANSKETLQPFSQKRQTFIKEKLDKWCADLGYKDTTVNMFTLSRSLNISKNELSRYFTVCLNSTFRIWLAEVRFEAAKKMMLDYPDYSNDIISAECGFSSRSYLYRIFKEKEGCSPTVWRAKIQ